MTAFRAQSSSDSAINTAATALNENTASTIGIIVGIAAVILAALSLLVAYLQLRANRSRQLQHASDDSMSAVIHWLNFESANTGEAVELAVHVGRETGAMQAEPVASIPGCNASLSLPSDKPPVEIKPAVPLNRSQTYPMHRSSSD